MCISRSYTTCNSIGVWKSHPQRHISYFSAWQLPQSWTNSGRLKEVRFFFILSWFKFPDDKYKYTRIMTNCLENTYTVNTFKFTFPPRQNNIEVACIIVYSKWFTCTSLHWVYRDELILVARFSAAACHLCPIHTYTVAQLLYCSNI